MDKYTEVFGVDISKDHFDVFSERYGHERFSNNDDGFHRFLEGLYDTDLVVMEATGYYHVLLLEFLNGFGVPSSLLNPLSVKRFIQMRLKRVKTDKSDAEMIRSYGLQEKVAIYQNKSVESKAMLQTCSMLEVYLKQRTMLKNKLHGEKTLGEPSEVLVKSLQCSITHMDQQIQVLENELADLVKMLYGNQKAHLCSIPGIGDRTAIYLLALTDGFSRFQTASQLISYAGMSPVIRESGSSVRGRSRISKMGNRRLRNLMFMCAFNACKHNPGCKAMYERITAKGKSKKLALIAVGNKLLRQAFAIGKSGLPFDPAYVSRVA
ncbi:IS110 family RNA-guided transposase [Nonlabens agnitus]|uniref:IS110 family transposase n=1 Tax=Nonlabens agnitus TaxID=870484 RepID=A0A2S9WTN9_9FLAO|nr:IS110 family transposase [Nonlabens agnitus]PRP66018.1 IS110 family transposase [Nonlabens agnitus]PRP66844.1 IS110 family transposase [Nonlabens agnitus]PRP66845.1 IS110 family transposase [Nonlabens agnitus]PRP67140.1 IS110 family transposase [Nonlabens agnitus]PRP67141.1 IS110 family transposase [Nonlabens agnitus]